jgi:hypothetical protein
MPARIAVIAEADADRRQVCELVGRKLRAHAPDWWDDEQLAAEREYCGLLPGTLFTRWRELRDLPSPEGALRRGGFIGFSGRMRHFDYPLGRKAPLSCTLASPLMDAVILIRDMDNQPKERAASLHEARGEIPAHRLKIALALPNAKREAWVLNGFEPQDEKERAALEAVRQELAFDPLSHAEKLDATTHGAKADAKRVLARLINDHTREARCWTATSWQILRQRGVHSGLTAFLQEVKDHLVPLVTGQPAHR